MAGYSAKIPYEGDEKYIFISYSHKNKAEAESFIGRLQHDGYRVWYDEGIHPGSEWDEFIATHVENCALFFALMSAEYMQSDNCKDELNFARDLNKKRVLIFLEEVEMPAGMRLRLGRLQNIHKKQYEDEEKFYQKTYLADGIDQCRDNQKADSKETDYVKTEDSLRRETSEDDSTSEQKDENIKADSHANDQSEGDSLYEFFGYDPKYFFDYPFFERIGIIRKVLEKIGINSRLIFAIPTVYICVGDASSEKDRVLFWLEDNEKVIKCCVGRNMKAWYAQSSPFFNGPSPDGSGTNLHFKSFEDFLIYIYKSQKYISGAIV